MIFSPSLQPVYYSIDSSALIHGWHRAYRPKNFGFVWERLETLFQEGRLKASIEVYNELEKKEDDLFKWCKERCREFFVEIDTACQEEMNRIMGVYPRLVDTVKGRSGGDPFVIALATTMKPAMTVVTEENPGKCKIPDVCSSENIPWMCLADMIEKEDWRFG